MRTPWICAYEEAKDKVWRFEHTFNMHRFNAETLYKRGVIYHLKGFVPNWSRLLPDDHIYRDIEETEVPAIVRLTWELLQ